MSGQPSIRELLLDATGRLHEAGVASPRVDAELLLAHALGVERSRLVTAEVATPEQQQAFQVLIARRVGREPLQHLLGTAAFRHLLLAVGPGVFVPRPETELLVDAVLPAIRAIEAPVVVDLCAGSGALALAVATEAVRTNVVAVERSAAALVWLKANVEAAAVGDRLQVIAADVGDPALMSDPARLAGLAGRVDVVVSNPPYVPSATPVGPEVDHDPGDAVFAGPDGLGLIPTVLRVAAALLRPGGRLALEHDDTHGETVPALLSNAGTAAEPVWADVVDHPDLTGRARFVTATRR